jgi:hypothetical protein
MTESREALGTPADSAADSDPTVTAQSGADFADEHDSTSFAAQLEGGPEEAAEPESPRGLSGMDG